MPKLNYPVILPLDHDNRRYEPGKQVELDDAVIDVPALIALGVIGAAVAAAAPAPASGASKPVDSAELMAALTAAIGQLDPNNLDLWLKDGKPSTEAIAAVTGYPITAAERDAAWNLASAA